MFRSRGWLICAALAAGVTLEATPPLSTIQDVLYSSDGNRFNGLLTISWPSFEASDTSNIAAQSMQIQVNGGILYVQLVPTTNADTPAVYTVQYNSSNGTLYTEAWAVPPTTSSLRVRDVRIAPGTVSGSSPSGSPSANSSSNSNSSSSGQIQISQVNGLQSALNIRPTEGSSFTVSRAAIIDATGSIDGAAGNLSDCLHVDGSSGACGSGTGATIGFVDAETPAGSVNNANALFTLANTPSPSSSLNLYRNGLLMNPSGDYTVSGNSITFQGASIPQSGDTLLASYRLGGSLPNVGFVDSATPSGTLDGVNSSFTLSQAPSPTTSAILYRNGVRQTPGLDYTLSGNTISFLGGFIPQPGDILLCSYRIAQ